LASLLHIEKLQAAKESRDYADVIRGALPWHCLVCCSAYGGDDLPNRAWGLLQHQLGVKATRSRRSSIEAGRASTLAGIRPRPPEYVLAMIEGRTENIAPKQVGGVLVLRGKNPERRDNLQIRR